MKRPKLLLSLIFVVILLLAVVRVTIENSISTTGIELVKLQEEVDKYEKENFQLQESYLAQSSLTRIASKAARLGFVASGKSVNLATPLPLARRQ